jgi:hypothetical protein
MKRYSKPVYQGRRLRRMVEMAQKSAKLQAREVAPLPQTQRVDRRLSAETIAELVQAYRDGIGIPELRRRYRLSQGSVITILHSHGVEMRGQGLADNDVRPLPNSTEAVQRWPSLASTSAAPPMLFGERWFRQAW